MEHLYLDILKYLEPYGIGVIADINFPLSKEFQRHHLIPATDDDKDALNYLTHKCGLINGLLKRMHGHIIPVDVPELLGFLNQPETDFPYNTEVLWSPNRPITVYLTAEGQSFLNSIRNNEHAAALNDSVIRTNEATLKLSQRQNRLYYVTLLIALLGVLFPALSYIRDTSSITTQAQKYSSAEKELTKLRTSYDSLKFIQQQLRPKSKH